MKNRKENMEAENHRIGRYFEKGCCHLFLILLCFFRFPICLYRLTVRTPGSHPSNRGSIPRGGAKKFRSFIGRFFCFWGRELRRAVGPGIACDCRGCNVRIAQRGAARSVCIACDCRGCNGGRARCPHRAVRGGEPPRAMQRGKCAGVI